MRGLFRTVAPRYNAITALLSYGMDAGWKRDALGFIDRVPDSLVLDLACGTADFSKLVMERSISTRTVQCDVTEEMLQLARNDGFRTLVCADAGRLPFADEVFDVILVGYGFRNFQDLDLSLEELHRVIRLGGALVSLDFFLPESRLWRTLYLGYLQMVGAFWGWLLHGKPRIYAYIADSLRSFVTAAEFGIRLRNAGFQIDTTRTYLGGGIGIHVARRIDVSLRAEAA